MLLVGGHFQAEGEKCGNTKRQADADDARGPSGPVEDSTEDRGADQAAGEVRGKIDPARRPAISSGGVAHKPGRGCLREERPMPITTKPSKTADRVGSRTSGRPTPAKLSAAHKVGRVP